MSFVLQRETHAAPRKIQRRPATTCCKTGGFCNRKSRRAEKCAKFQARCASAAAQAELVSSVENMYLPDAGRFLRKSPSSRPQPPTASARSFTECFLQSELAEFDAQFRPIEPRGIPACSAPKYSADYRRHGVAADFSPEVTTTVVVIVFVLFAQTQSRLAADRAGRSNIDRIVFVGREHAEIPLDDTGMGHGVVAFAELGRSCPR